MKHLSLYSCIILIAIFISFCKKDNIKTPSIKVDALDKNIGAFIDTANNRIYINLGGNHNPRVYGSSIKIVNGLNIIDLPDDVSDPVSVEINENSIAVTYTVIATYARANYRIKTDHEDPERDIIIPMQSNEYCPTAYYGNIMPLITSVSDQLVIDFNECPTSNSIKLFIKPEESEPNVEGEYNLALVRNAGCWVTYQNIISGFGQYGQSNQGEITILKHDVENNLISGYVKGVTFPESDPTGIKYEVEGVFYNIPIK